MHIYDNRSRLQENKIPFYYRLWSSKYSDFTHTHTPNGPWAVITLQLACVKFSNQKYYKATFLWLIAFTLAFVHAYCPQAADSEPKSKLAICPGSLANVWTSCGLTWRELQMKWPWLGKMYLRSFQFEPNGVYYLYCTTGEAIEMLRLHFWGAFMVDSLLFQESDQQLNKEHFIKAWITGPALGRTSQKATESETAVYLFVTVALICGFSSEFLCCRDKQYTILE